MKLFVGNLSFNTTEDDLKTLFSDAQVVRLVTDRESGKSRGFAFLTYRADESATSAMEKYNNTEIGGRIVSISEARERQGTVTNTTENHRNF